MRAAAARRVLARRRSKAQQYVQDAPGLILPPPSQTGKPMGLVLIPGIGIDSSAYLPVLASMQRLASSNGLALFASCATFDWSKAPLCHPGDLKAPIDKLVTAMRDQGLPPCGPVFHAAHSMSTIFLQDLLSAGHKSDGQILLGGLLLRKYSYPSFAYHLPTLTIGAQLDGVERISRMAEQHHIQSYLDQMRFPLVMLEGQTHIQFASGRPPAHMQHELPAAVEEYAAHEAISEVAVDFMRVRLGLKHSGAALDKRLRSTKQMLLPLMMSQQTLALAGAGPGLRGAFDPSMQKYEPELSMQIEPYE